MMLSFEQSDRETQERIEQSDRETQERIEQSDRETQKLLTYKTTIFTHNKV